jgi:hypothetical protein
MLESETVLFLLVCITSCGTTPRLGPYPNPLTNIREVQWRRLQFLTSRGSSFGSDACDFRHTIPTRPRNCGGIGIVTYSRSPRCRAYSACYDPDLDRWFIIYL